MSHYTCKTCGQRYDDCACPPKVGAGYPADANPPTDRDRSHQLAKLVLELADAVDNAAEDIGGSRPQLTILREAVVVAEAIVK